MNKVYLQIWEESDLHHGIIPDGCSLHLSIEDRNSYVNSIYSKRSEEIPDNYNRIIGEPIEVGLIDSFFGILERYGSIRLMEHEMNNLLDLDEIIVKDA